MRRIPALTASILALAVLAAAPAAHAQSDPTRAQALSAAAASLAGQVGGSGSLSASRRAAIHAAKAELVAAAYGDATPAGPTYATVFTALDCIGREVQKARSGRGPAAAVARAATCQRSLAGALKAGGRASASLRSGVAALGTQVRGVRDAIRRKRAFGAKATALRRQALALVKRHFPGKPVGGVAFPVAYERLECVDVKVEAGNANGAGACARALARTLKSTVPKVVPPPKDPITFGSDLSGDPVALPGVYQDDTEFWTSALTVPADGMITAFRLKVGANPVDLPLRFSVVRPRPDGQVEVQTTTNPVYPLAGGTPGTFTYATSVLSFKCCKVQAGDIVTVDNSGTTTRDPYTWFARKEGSTTFSHTMGGDSQNKGVLWTGVPNAGYEVLLQVVMQPS